MSKVTNSKESQNFEATNKLVRDYSDSFNQYGATASGVGWSDHFKHQLRLNYFAKELMLFNGGYESIIDVGCVYGELLTFLRDHLHELEKNI